MITLSSDFGSPYPAAMRGVIAAQTDTRIIDIAHDFPRGDIRTTAFWLREILPWFPPAVHLVVVDPGVGTDRGVLAIAADDHVLVGPDNGVLIPVADSLDEGEFEVFELVSYRAESQTFHGRDVFAPLAARLHEREEDTLLAVDGLHRTETYVDLAFPHPTVTAEVVVGEVLVVDGFGNAITNIPGDVVTHRFGEDITVNGDRVPLERTYAHVEPNERLVTIGSHGNVELAVRDGRGSAAFDVNTRSTVRIRK